MPPQQVIYPESFKQLDPQRQQKVIDAVNRKIQGKRSSPFVESGRYDQAQGQAFQDFLDANPDINRDVELGGAYRISQRTGMPFDVVAGVEKPEKIEVTEVPAQELPPKVVSVEPQKKTFREVAKERLIQAKEFIQSVPKKAQELVREKIITPYEVARERRVQEAQGRLASGIRETAPVLSGRGTIITTNKPFSQEELEKKATDFNISSAEREASFRQALEVKQKAEIDKKVQVYERDIINYRDGLQRDINAGKLSVPEAEERLKGYTTTKEENLVKEVEGETKDYASQLGRKVRLAQGARTAIIGVVTGGAQRYLATARVGTGFVAGRVALQSAGVTYGAISVGKEIETLKALPTTKEKLFEGAIFTAEVLSYLAGGYAGYKLGVGSIASKKLAYESLNQRIEQGMKFTPKQIKQGYVDIKYTNPQGIVTKETLNIRSTEMQTINNRIDRIGKAKQKLGLSKDIKIESAGIENEAVIKNQLIEASPESQSIIQSSRIGKYERVTKGGQIEKGYILTRGIKTPEGEKVVSVIFKLTKTNKIQKPKIIVKDIQSKEILIAEPTSPSTFEAPIEVPTPSGNAIISPINRFTGRLAVSKGVIRKQVTQEVGNKKMILTERDIYAGEVGRVKGTLSYEDIIQFPKGLVVTKKKTPIKITKSQERIIELKETRPVKVKQDYFDVEVGKLTKTLGITRAEVEDIPIAKIPKRVRLKETKQLTQAQIDKLVKKTEEILTPKPTQKLELKEVTTGGFDFNTAIIGKAIKGTKAPVKTISAKKVINTFKNNQRVVTRTLQSVGKVHISKQLEKTIQVKAPKVKEKDILGLRERTKQLGKLMQRTTPKMRLEQLQKFKISQSPKLPIPTFDFNIQNLPTGTPIGFLKDFEKKRQLKKTLKKLGKAESRYTASLGSALFQTRPVKVTKKQLEKLNKKTFSGLEIRPVLEIVPEKKGIDFSM